MTIGQVMRAVRKRHRMTQKALAEKLGVGQSAVSMFEGDICTPSKSVMLLVMALTETDEERQAVSRALQGLDCTQTDYALSENVTDAAINEQLNRADLCVEGGITVDGTYAQGVADAMRWLLGLCSDAPLDYPVEGEEDF